MMELWLVVFDGVGSGDEERLQFKKQLNIILEIDPNILKIFSQENQSLLSQNLSPFQNSKSNLIVFCAFISSRKALVVKSHIES